MFKNMSNRQYQSMQNPNDQRIWGPILVGAAIVSAPFWIGLSNKNNNNNNCCYPQYYPQYYPQPYQPQPYYSPYPSYVENNNYYI